MDGPADQHLVVAGTVDVGGVDQRDAEVEGAVDGGDRLVPVRRAVPLAHPHAAQPLRRDLQVTQPDAVDAHR